MSDLIDKIKTEVQAKMIKQVKEKGNFRFNGQEVPRQAIIAITALECINITNEGRAFLRCLCEYKTIEAGSNCSKSCLFDVSATCDISIDVAIDNQPISLRLR